MMNGQERLPHELSPKKELFPHFEKVVLGHNWRDVDADQLTTYCLSRTLGMIDQSTPVTVTNLPTDDDCLNENVLVIEGIPAKHKPTGKTNLRKTGNVDNSPQNEPAAFVLYQDFTREIKAKFPQLHDKINAFTNWYKSIEQKKQFQTNLFDSDDLTIWSKSLFAIKLAYQNEPHLVYEKAYQAFENVLKLKPDSKPLSEIYAEELHALDQKQKANNEKLEKASKEEPQRFQKVTTLSGVTIASADIRGLDIDKGTIGFVENETNADVILLIDDEYDNEGEIQGIRYLFKDMKGTPDDSTFHDLLSARLTMNETLFGAGFEITDQTRFDGHPGIIGSPRTGSELQSNEIWHALEVFYDYERFTPEKWEAEKNNFAQITGIKKLMVGNLSNTRPDLLPEQTMVLSVNDENGIQQIITISESEYGFYKKAIESIPESSEKAKLISQLLLQKTNIEESHEISLLRKEFAEKGLQHYLSENNAVRVLDMLDIMNESSIRNLDESTRRRILESVASSNQAISHLIDPEDFTYRMEKNDLPGWIKNEVAHQKTARFSMRAVQYKFHQIILPMLAKEPSSLTHLFRILESPTYKETRRPNNPDRILDTISTILTSLDIPQDLKENSIAILNDNSKDSENSWRTLAQRSPLLFLRISELIPKLTKFKEIENLNIKEIKGVPGGTVSVKSAEEIQVEFQRQIAEKEQPVLNILVAVGRPIAEQLINEGANLVNGDTLRFNHNSFGININKEGSWIDDQLVEDPLIAKELVDQVIEHLDKIPAEAKIRIIRGGYPNPLTHAVVELLLSNPQITEEYKKKILFLDYDQGKKVYFETPLRFASKYLL